MELEKFVISKYDIVSGGKVISLDFDIDILDINVLV